MTTEQWLNQARANADALRDLIRSFHPVQRQPGPRKNVDYITAPNTEAACVQVRRQIREDFEGDPVAKFDEALTAGDAGKVMSVISDTWFGVPESTQCWKMTGFKEAVDLLDDPPGDGEDTDG